LTSYGSVNTDWKSFKEAYGQIRTHWMNILFLKNPSYPEIYPDHYREFISKLHHEVNSVLVNLCTVMSSSRMWQENFLKHWVNGNFPEGKAKHPVVWVSLKDAQAYCAYAGKRLPTEEEWQKAAQGDDGRDWPWGNIYDPGKGDPDSDIDPGTPFADLPDDWVCPMCGAAKSDFEPVK